MPSRFAASTITMVIVQARRRPYERSLGAGPDGQVATGLAAAGRDFVAPVLAEIILRMGGEPGLTYATPGTEAMADAFFPLPHDGGALLPADHGAIPAGPSVRVARRRREHLEQAPGERA